MAEAFLLGAVVAVAFLMIDWFIEQWNEGNLHERLASVAIIATVTAAGIRWGHGRLFRGFFNVRILDINETIRPEGMKEGTAARVESGRSTLRLSIRPRRGIRLTVISLAVFDRGWRPLSLGERRSNDVIRIVNISLPMVDFQPSQATGIATHLDLSESIVDNARLLVDIEVDVSIKEWEGVLGLDLVYDRDGNPSRSHVHEKFFVKPVTAWRPVRAIGKRVMRGQAVSD